MTPQESQLVSDLFRRLASLENSPRDGDAERVIRDGLKTSPNAVYALVQTVLVQDEALKRADARIQELEGGGAPARSGGFLDSMRDMLSGRPSGSVPNSGSRWGTQPQQPLQATPQGPAPGERGGSFLGTAAAAAAGVIGGSLLMNSIGSMFGHHGQAFGGQAFGGDDARSGGQTPWGDSANSDLSRDAGINDIGGQRSGLFDGSGNDSDFDISDAGGGDFGGGDGGGGDA
jgi:hypothetical protein